MSRRPPLVHQPFARAKPSRSRDPISQSLVSEMWFETASRCKRRAAQRLVRGLQRPGFLGIADQEAVVIAGLVGAESGAALPVGLDQPWPSLRALRAPSGRVRGRVARGPCRSDPAAPRSPPSRRPSSLPIADGMFVGRPARNPQTHHGEWPITAYVSATCGISRWVQRAKEPGAWNAPRNCRKGWHSCSERSLFLPKTVAPIRVSPATATMQSHMKRA